MKNNNHSCFCKNCVPSPACELKKVKAQYDRLIKQKKNLYQELTETKQNLKNMHNCVIHVYNETGCINYQALIDNFKKQEKMIELLKIGYSEFALENISEQVARSLKVEVINENRV